jgi:hypothetical protein
MECSNSPKVLNFRPGQTASTLLNPNIKKGKIYPKKTRKYTSYVVIPDGEGIRSPAMPTAKYRITARLIGVDILVIRALNTSSSISIGMFNEKRKASHIAIDIDPKVKKTGATRTIIFSLPGF